MQPLRIFLLIFNLFLFTRLSAQEKIKIRINDSTYYEHEVIVIQNDTVDGKKIAVYKNDTSVIAYQKSYYNGYQTGVYKIYFPNGRLMETYVYMKGMKNGEYSLYSLDGILLIKGKYLNDLRDGTWAYRMYRLYGKFKKGKKHGKWKWFTNDELYYVYKFEKDKLLSVSPTKNVPDFPEYLIKE